ncbi:MAG: transcriptional regulator [Sneathiella sp.]|jgi:transcriptional regulator|uniref:FMN-binding negative transcriptional regulator n=1 Tax=Sneathiella sp. TaxID=1964365 RepID=UPI000C508CAC|nr:FMN-binding negative transcriptional regulator [Sneathiella sp.]MAL78958.1 transcriptional regulator [Sneathiella sp.]|tara:strand:+ start:51 stop:629 length:579 start_codon:yes stop_codon:yes gene_type:complete
MYVPPHFAAPGKETLIRLLPTASFATLVSIGEEGRPVATHLPFCYDETRGENGTLIAHMARANPHGNILERGEALVIFQGPHVYISPSYYATEINVPTWNYVAVHVYGRPKIIEDPAKVRHLLDRLTHENEKDMENPWRADQLDDRRLKGLMQGIIAFEIPLSRIEGKAKLGQNKSAVDQAGVEEAIGRLWG